VVGWRKTGYYSYQYGSEVHIAFEAGKILQNKGVIARVVSLPSWELFDAQTNEYRNEILPDSVRARISIEAGSTIGWSVTLVWMGLLWVYHISVLRRREKLSMTN